MPGWGSGFQWWAWVLGAATTAVFWALVIWSIVALVRWAHEGNRPAGPGGLPGRPGSQDSRDGQDPRDAGDKQDSRDLRGSRDMRGAGDRGDDGGAPGRTLASRYPAGEIGTAEYHRRAGAVCR